MSMFSKENIPSTKLVLSTAASLAASAMLIRTIANDFLPSEAQNYIFSTFRSISNHLSSQLTIVIEESDGLSVNKIYEATNTYLGTKVNRSTRRLKVCKLEKEKKFEITMDKNEEVVDVFQGVKLKWRFVCTPLKTLNTGFNRHGQNMFSFRSENRAFELSFHKKHKQTVLDHYLPYLLREFQAIKEESKVLKLHTIDFNSGDYWRSVNLDHPATFDTIAMDSDLKNTLIHDLDKFIERKDMYKRVGKAWKRGYLLYGPPGTGKSSLIAAVGNYLNFDIYDMDLTDIRCNSDLRRILLATSNRSILVLEDIDCTSKLENREMEIDGRSNHENEVTLSGVLNFIDGLWSSCGDERIIIFTTNHKEKLDPALLRPGRMDIHVHMSYCTPDGFKVLASNYLGIHDHLLFKEIIGLIEEVETTPAEIAGELMKSDDTEIALQGLYTFLKQMMTKHNVTNKE